MNPNKKLKSIRGEEYPKTFPLQEEIKKIKGNMNKLEKETVGNVILNCLANYVAEDRKEGFYVNAIAQSVLSGKEKIEFKKKFQDFLIKVLDNQTLIRTKDEKGQETKQGIYQAWVIAQIKNEFGITDKE